VRNGLQTRGFSILELLIVVMLISILAVIVLPKVTNVEQQVQISEAEKAAGSIGAAVNIAHASWIAAGSDKVTVIKVDGKSFTMNKHGWPESIGLQDSSGSMTAHKCLDIWNNLMDSPPSANLVEKCNEHNCEFAVKVSEKNPSQCVFIDNGGKGFNVIIYDVDSGNVTLTSK
jgi:prepilin-type N-terminal cleavage/methylation domain-containing protein